MNEAAFKKLHQNITLNARRPSPTRKSNNPTYKLKQVNCTVSDLMEIFYSKQDKKCHWFGIELNPSWIFIPNHPLALSVDRLSYDYDKDSVVICSRFSNLGRNTCPDDLFIDAMKYLKHSWEWDGYLKYPAIQEDMFSL
tara:strand:- start:745 stop:1161 length:417 start_codon:yes stop_codon:yes gene_type:complete